MPALSAAWMARMASLSSLAPYRAPPIGQVPKPMTEVQMSDAPKHRVFIPYGPFHSCSSRSFLRAGVEVVAEAVAEDTDAEDDQTEREAGHGGNPPGVVQVVAAVGDGLPPGGLAGRRAQAEEAQRG